MSLRRYKVAAGVAVSDMDRAREFYEGKLALLVSIDSGDNLQSIRIVAQEKVAGPSLVGHLPFFRYEEEGLSAVVRLGSLASKARLSLSQLALTWILRQDNVSSTIVGASRPEQVGDNAEASGARLSPEVAFERDSILKDVEIRYSLVDILGTKLGRPHPFTHSQTWT